MASIQSVTEWVILADLEVKAQTNEEATTVDKVTRLQRYALDEWAERLDAIRKNNSMFRGGEGQWTEANATLLKSQGRPVISINIELPLVLQLLGSFRSQNKDWKVLPVDDFADDMTADVLTKLMKHVYNDNDLDFVIDDVRQQGVVGSIGWYYVETVDNDSEQPRIRISVGDNTLILVDPDAKRLDQSDWKWLVRSEWMRWKDIQDTWDKAPKEPPNSEFIKRFWEQVSSRIRSWFRGDVDTELVDRKNDLYRVIELWEMKTEKTDTIERLDPMTAKLERKVVKRITSQDDVNMLEADGWTRVSGGKRNYMHLTVVLPYSDTILAEEDLPYAYYPFVPFIPLRVAGTPLPDCFSYTENLHGVQEEKNTSHSILTDSLQRMPLGGAILPAGEEELKKDMEGRASQPGQYFVRHTQAGEIMWLNQVFPSGYSRLLEINDADIRTVSGQPLAQAGIGESSDESGVLFNSRVQQGLTTLTPIFMAETQSRRLLGRVVLDRIQKDYNVPMVFRITGMDEEAKIMPESIAINMPGVEDALNDLDNGRYDIVLDEAPTARTEREMQFKAWAELIKGLPPEIQVILLPDLIELSGLPNRKDRAEKIRAMFAPPQPSQLPPGMPGQMPPAEMPNAPMMMNGNGLSGQAA